MFFHPFGSLRDFIHVYVFHGWTWDQSSANTREGCGVRRGEWLTALYLAQMCIRADRDQVVAWALGLHNSHGPGSWWARSLRFHGHWTGGSQRGWGRRASRIVPILTCVRNSAKYAGLHRDGHRGVDGSCNGYRLRGRVTECTAHREQRGTWGRAGEEGIRSGCHCQRDRGGGRQHYL